MSYDSPIEIVKKMQEQYETDIVNNVLKCVQSYGINVDKDELIKALKYDRQQYEKGYADGIKGRYNLFEEFVDWYKKVLEQDYDDKADRMNKTKEETDWWFFNGQCTAVHRLITLLDNDLEKFLEEKNEL